MYIANRIKMYYYKHPAQIFTGAYTESDNREWSGLASITVSQMV